MKLLNVVGSVSGNHIGEEIVVIEPGEDEKVLALRQHVARVIGFRLQEARSSAKMSQSRLAWILGVHRNTLNRWEQGDGELDATSVYIACCVLNISPIALLKTVTMPPRKDTL